MTNLTTVRLSDDLVRRMRKLTASDGVPGSEQIRRALDEFLNKKKIYASKKEKK